MTEDPKVFGIGLSRTGTTSLNYALRQLGLRSRHWPSDPTTRREILAYLRDRPDRLHLTLLEQLDAITDSPACVAFKALDASYPGSQFILTVREEEQWLASCKAFWRRKIEPHFACNPDGQVTRFARAINEELFDGAYFEVNRFRDARLRYHAQVRDTLSSTGRLLELDVSEHGAFPKLCSFLNRPGASGEAPFPHRNRRADVRQTH